LSNFSISSFVGGDADVAHLLVFRLGVDASKVNSLRVLLGHNQGSPENGMADDGATWNVR
jgi:hypothetical protein